jgi:outer membrane protein OmpA-like peptidoglycan-associated protein
MAKDNKRIGYAIVGVLALGLGAFIVYKVIKNSKSKKECEKKGGKWDTKTKTCIIETPPVFQDVIAKAYDNLTFVTNSDVIKKSSYPFLKDIVDYLKQNPTFSIKITGHTDNVGNDAYNLDLSRRRAESVKKFFITNGIGEIVITTDGKGETEPIADNNTAEGRAKNRRVVFEVTKLEEQPQPIQ